MVIGSAQNLLLFSQCPHITNHLNLCNQQEMQDLSESIRKTIYPEYVKLTVPMLNS